MQIKFLIYKLDLVVYSGRCIIVYDISNKIDILIGKIIVEYYNVLVFAIPDSYRHFQLVYLHDS